MTTQTPTLELVSKFLPPPPHIFLWIWTPHTLPLPVL